MATLFDAITVLQGLGVYTVILPFLLVIALVYGLLSKFKPFGESREINSIISVVLALLFTASIRASAFLQSFSVFFTGFLVILLMLMLVFTFIGVKSDTMADVFKEPAGYGTILVIFLLIFFVVLGQVLPEGGLVTQAPEEAARLGITTGAPPGATPSQQAGAILFTIIAGIIFSPVILGLIILLLLFGVAAYFITREVPKTGG